MRPPPRPTLFPYTTLFRSRRRRGPAVLGGGGPSAPGLRRPGGARARDRKSTRLNSSHGSISYAVFCLKKKKEECPVSGMEAVQVFHKLVLMRSVRVFLVYL